jgi:hypothetical protein
MEFRDMMLSSTCLCGTQDLYETFHNDSQHLSVFEAIIMFAGIQLFLCQVGILSARLFTHSQCSVYGCMVLLCWITKQHGQHAHTVTTRRTALHSRPLVCRFPPSVA